jgi:hypothetical protein
MTDEAMPWETVELAIWRQVALRKPDNRYSGNVIMHEARWLATLDERDRQLAEAREGLERVTKERDEHEARADAHADELDKCHSADRKLAASEAENARLTTDLDACNDERAGICNRLIEAKAEAVRLREAFARFQPWAKHGASRAREADAAADECIEAFAARRPRLDPDGTAQGHLRVTGHNAFGRVADTCLDERCERNGGPDRHRPGKPEAPTVEPPLSVWLRWDREVIDWATLVPPAGATRYVRADLFERAVALLREYGGDRVDAWQTSRLALLAELDAFEALRKKRGYLIASPHKPSSEAAEMPFGESGERAKK